MTTYPTLSDTLNRLFEHIRGGYIKERGPKSVNDIVLNEPNSYYMSLFSVKNDTIKWMYEFSMVASYLDDHFVILKLIPKDPRVFSYSL
jgi:hypothetical protein